MRIRLVEDDPACQVSTVMMLRHLGHTVVTADDAQEGLARFDRALHDLGVTDHRMPGMSGSSRTCDPGVGRPIVVVGTPAAWLQGTVGS